MRGLATDRRVGSGSVPPLAVRSGMTTRGKGAVRATFSSVVIPDGRAALGAAEPEPTSRSDMEVT